MKKAKINPKKEIGLDTDEINTVKTAIITMLVIAVAFVVFYYLTAYIIERNRSLFPTGESAPINQYISFRDLLTQDEDEYYVIAIFEEDINERLYRLYFNQGRDIERFHIDLRDAFNRVHMAEETSIGERIRDISISDSTLFIIKDGQIEAYFVGSEAIIAYLQTQMQFDEDDE